MEEKIKDLIGLLELKQQQVKEINPKGLTQYAEGKLDGLNIAIREIGKLLK